MLILVFVLVQEFAFGMDVLLRGTPAQKCAFMFDVFDENGDEVLTPEDLLRVLSHPGCLFAATKGRIPPVVSRSLILLVGGIVLLIDDDQAESTVGNGGEEG